MSEMDIDTVRAATVAARQRIGALPPAGTAEQVVRDGSALLRHGSATPNLNTVAERLQELLTELTRLAGDVVDALDQAAATVQRTDAANAEQFTAGQAGRAGRELVGAGR